MLTVIVVVTIVVVVVVIVVIVELYYVKVDNWLACTAEGPEFESWFGLISGVGML